MTIIQNLTAEEQGFMASMTAWNIYLQGAFLETAWFMPSLTAEDVRDSLIEHDGYPDSITIKKVG